MKNKTNTDAPEATYNEGKTCPQCSKAVPDKPLNKVYCSDTCRNDFFNSAKKNRRLELEQLKIETEIQTQKNQLQNTINESEEVKKKKAEMRLHLLGMKIPEEGRVVDVNYLNQVGFDINLFDDRIELKNVPGAYMLEFGDYGMFWVDTYNFLFTHKQNYLSWL